MKDIHATMTPEELAEYRRKTAELRVMESGSVPLVFEDAVAIVEEHRACWTRMHEKYGLDREEFYVFDEITGTISVDKAE